MTLTLSGLAETDPGTAPFCSTGIAGGMVTEEQRSYIKHMHTHNQTPGSCPVQV